jgi:ketosteroid isomerase-like protein
VLTGPGWRLELAEGWVVAPGPRSGDFRVVPEPKVPIVAALRRMVDAVNGRDARAYAAIYASDASLTIYGGPRLQGRAAIEKYELDLLRAYPGTRFALSNIWVRGFDVVARYGVNTPAGAGPATGHEGLLFFRFDEGGNITSEHRYLDALTPMAQAGLLRGVAARVLPNLAAGPKVMTADPAQNGSVLEKVSAVFAAFDSGDAIGLLSQLHDDIAVDDVMLASASSCKSGTLDWLRTWAEAVSDRRTDVVRAIVVRDSVLVEIIAHGKLSGPIGALAPAERRFAVHRAAIIEFRDDQIGHITILTNGRDLAEQTAQWPPRTTRGVNATRLRDRVRERHVPVGIVLSGRGRLGREVPDSRLDRTVDRGGHAGPPFCFGGGLAK